MLRKTIVFPAAENIPTTATVTMKSNDNQRLHSSSKSHIRSTNSSSLYTWVSQLRAGNIDIKREDESDVKKPHSGNRSPMRIFRIMIIFLFIGIVLLVRLRPQSWLRKYRYMMWYDTSENDSYNNNMNKFPPVRLLSLPNTTIISSSEMMDPNYNQNNERRMTGRVSVDSWMLYHVHCTVTTDVRGNLGPASVLIQNQTLDWIKDRWQAASDMHGTNIHGPHNVQLEWTYDVVHPTKDTIHLRRASTISHSTPHRGALDVVLKRIVLDWEAAYSDNYDIQIWNDLTQQWVSIFIMRPLPPTKKKQPPPPLPVDENATTASAKFDITGGIVIATEWGQSPGVTFPTPLHIIHDISLSDPSNQFQNLTTWTTPSSKMRIVIHTSATGWGVSLWQVQVYGNYVRPQ